MEYASKGVAGAGLGLGIAGTALGLLNGGFGNFLGGAAVCGENTPVTRYEMTMAQELAACIQQQVAALQGLTKLVVPKESVCPEPMDRYNSWTAPTTGAATA